ncbi:MAG: NAD(P)H-dependent oxidoreductase [Bacteroidota bacterium]
MITVISGTNRLSSNTRVFAVHFQQLLLELGAPSQLLDLADYEASSFLTHRYESGTMTEELRALQERFLFRADKVVFFVPEYNGSYPGVVKLFIDGLSVHRYDEMFSGKKIALLGVSTGRAGNLRGIDHLADVIAHMGGWVFPNKLPLSSVGGLIEDGQLTDPDTIATLKTHAEQLIAA